MPDEKIRLTHPQLPGAEQWASPSAVANWERKGWRAPTPVAPPPTPVAPPPAAASTTPEEEQQDG